MLWHIGRYYNDMIQTFKIHLIYLQTKSPSS